MTWGPPMSKPTRWSYSSLSTWKQCPQKWKFSYIDCIPWPPSAAMARGTRMHLMAEEFVKGTAPAVHTEIQKIGPLLQMLIGYKAKTEEVWMLDRDWKPTQDSAKAWVKTIVDVHYIADDVLYVKDYKSGRTYPDHANQLELYGLVGLCSFPKITRVETSAVYMDTGHEGHQGSIIRAMLPKLVDRWEKDATAMMADDVHEPRPGNACKWCPYAKSKGGPCAY